ncbi:hypothetical protein [Ruminococcus albus]|jgi:hypothetical protein|uniref:Uncharacterized protein n=1 Tax=Ruminococcus albus SY3 TaxID=1341156 RepID=A0A011UZX3_RUMAL|nr:hypothetical protein [Ruminococcus albus]EXM38742.1 hypothetical protein RASY3_19570 [Ruminococcus albus SY3]EXM39129.1 hypothetical protein RASY3_10880 [Ruminococcus albus SY3]
MEISSREYRHNTEDNKSGRYDNGGEVPVENTKGDTELALTVFGFLVCGSLDLIWLIPGGIKRAKLDSRS